MRSLFLVCLALVAFTAAYSQIVVYEESPIVVVECPTESPAVYDAPVRRDAVDERQSLAVRSSQKPPENDAHVETQDSERDALRMIQEGRNTFRYDTFGDEAFWGGALGLHQAIAGERLGGVGEGVSPKTALAVGLKVDAEVLPPELTEQIARQQVNLDDPATTLALLKLDAVVGVRGFFDDRDQLQSVGITCAICHSTVDDSFSPGIGRRLDGWPNRDLNIGKIISLVPNPQPLTERLEIAPEQLKQALLAWGPGKYDAELFA